MEKILKRLTWLLSTCLFVIFGSFAVSYFLKIDMAQKQYNFWMPKYSDTKHDCHKYNMDCANTKSPQQMAIESTNNFSYIARKTRLFTFLAFAAPFSVWLLFFSLRWVVTGYVPWRRGIDVQVPTKSSN